MADQLAANPFAALFSSLEDAKAFTERTAISQPDTEPSSSSQFKAAESCKPNEEKEINYIAERIFRLSFQKDPKERAVKSASYFPEVSEMYLDKPLISSSNLNHILFEVLVMDQHAPDFQISHRLDNERVRLEEVNDVEKTEVLTYLYCSYRRLSTQQEKYKKGPSEGVENFLKECRDLILLNTRMCLQQPDLYQFQDFVSQFIVLCLEEDLPISDPNNRPCVFLCEVCEEIHSNSDQGTLIQAVGPVLQEVTRRLTADDMTVVNRDAVSYIKVMHFFTSSSALATIFLSLNTPEPSQNFHGRIYEKTPIGAALSLSILPRSRGGPYKFFSKPSTQSLKEVEMVEQSVWRATEEVLSGVHKIFVDLMKTSAEIKHYTLRWLGLCIQGNAGRAKLWASNLPADLFVSDAFAVNLTQILLLFCRPFSNPKSEKLLKIQPSYTQVTANGDAQMLKRSIHLLGLPKETFLVPGDDLEKVEEDESYTFITECFFITQKAFQVLFQPIVSKLVSTNRDIHQIQRLYQEISQQAAANDEPVQSIKNKMEQSMSLYLTLKAALTQPQLLSLSLNFHIASSAWLSLVATRKLPRLDKIDSATKLPSVEFPLTEDIPGAVACIPEFIAENISHFVNHVHRFQDSVLESEENKIEHLLTFVLVFMSSPRRMKNPHLRAQLAEMLASLMPIQEQRSNAMSISQFHREQLFERHPHISYLAESLMHVFVSIEMTGESVAFEEKFNYRRPMYAILKYIWEIQFHKDRIKELAEHAEENMSAPDPPLFLRFINLLVNDATFLLDEALMFMGQIKELQRSQASPEWRDLPENQRQQESANLQQVTRLAQYHNVMASSTISSVRLLTSHIQSTFTHPTFVDRVASMLNYFLSRLVGPKQKEFVVKDKETFEFRPHETVSMISAIYLNLQGSELFCQAVFQDQRSYTEHLFSQASQVMERIGESPQAIMDFMNLDEKIKILKASKESQEQALADAPDEFLDPIMGTLMSDPVMLPASKNIVDRNVIARHILSDQTDPFNRQPLSLDQVIPQPELKAKIDAWIQEKTAGL